MSKKSFSQRTLGIIEQRWARGISVVSIAGELGTHPEKVKGVVDRLERERQKTIGSVLSGRGKDCDVCASANDPMFMCKQCGQKML